MATTAQVPETHKSWPHVRQLPVELVETHVPWIESQLASGGVIELMRGQKIIAEMRAPATPTCEQTSERHPMPDFLGRMKTIWGEVPMDTDITEVIREDRDARG